MHLAAVFLALLASVLPAAAQIEFNPLPGQDATCGAFSAMSPGSRLHALRSIEPVGGELADADPAIVQQWIAEVAAACAGQPDLPLADAAASALGGD